MMLAVLEAPAPLADVASRGLRALQRHHPEHYLLYLGVVVEGRSMQTVARSLGVDLATATSESAEAELILAAWERGLWNGEDEADIGALAGQLEESHGTVRSRAEAALQEHHAQKWAVYEQCILRGTTQRSVGARLGLAASTVKAHVVDARLIVAAFETGIWNGQHRFSFPATARKYGGTERELRRELVTFATRERPCNYCGECYRPHFRVRASRFCSAGCRSAARERPVKPCPYPGCNAQILETSCACRDHYHLLAQSKTCKRCGEAFSRALGTRTLYCAACKPLSLLSNNRRSWRASHPADRPCVEPGCAQLVTSQSSSGYCRSHAAYHRNDKKHATVQLPLWPSWAEAS